VKELTPMTKEMTIDLLDDIAATKEMIFSHSEHRNQAFACVAVLGLGIYMLIHNQSNFR
jgi:hypothetical protein